MSYYDTPERPLEPPEDKRRSVFSCAICEWDIFEGDDYYDIPSLGPCCVTCISESKRYDAELDYPSREED